MNKNLAFPLFLVFPLLVLQVAFAQDTTRIDSLNKILLKAPDSSITNVFDMLSRSLETLDRNQAIRLAKRSLDQANAGQSNVAKVLAHRNLGKIYTSFGAKDEALRNFQAAVTIARSNPQDQFALGLALFHYGQFLTEQGLLAESLQNILEASKIFEAQKDYSNVILCHYEACTIHYVAKSYQQCIEEGYRVIEFHEKLLANKQTDGSSFQKMSTYNTIALANTELKQYDMALINFDKAEAIARKIKNEFWIGLINGNKAVVLKNTGKSNEAIQSLVADYNTSKKFKVWSSAGRSALEMADIYIQQKRFPEARLYLDSALRMFLKDSDILNARRGISAYWKISAQLKASTKDYSGAYRSLTRHVELRDSLSHEMEAMNIAKVKASYDFDRKQSEIELLTKNSEIQQERIRNQDTLFIATLVVLLLVVILAVTLIYNFQKQKNISALVKLQHDEIEAKNKELEGQGIKLQENNQYIQSLNSQLEQKVAERTLQLELTNKELDTFLYRSSHDMRRPITTLLGLDQVARHVIHDNQVNLLFDKVAETAINMDSMLFKMQMMYELNKVDLSFEPVPLRHFMARLVGHFKSQLEKNKITTHISTAEELTILSNPVLLTIIFRNLIENAILFRKTQPGTEPFMDISLKKTNQSVEITVADNGIGIEDKYHPQLYELYFRASQASKGNGLGLYLVKKSVEKLNGSIQMMSDYGVGSTFTIILPMVQ